MRGALFFATREGHTRRIAERIAIDLRARQVDVDVFDVKTLGASLEMKRIARKAGAPTDTSRDYEFTDWAALDRFVGDVVQAAEMRAETAR